MGIGRWQELSTTLEGGHILGTAKKMEEAKSSRTGTGERMEEKERAITHARRLLGQSARFDLRAR